MGKEIRGFGIRKKVNQQVTALQPQAGSEGPGFVAPAVVGRALQGCRHTRQLTVCNGVVRCAAATAAKQSRAARDVQDVSEPAAAAAHAQSSRYRLQRSTRRGKKC